MVWSGWKDCDRDDSRRRGRVWVLRVVVGFVALFSMGAGMIPEGDRVAHAGDSTLLHSVGLKRGQPVPAVTLYDAVGRPVLLGGKQPTFSVYLSGCNTCQIFLGKVDSFEQIARDYAGANVRFFYLHKGLVHPELRNLHEPYTLRERRLLIDQYQAELQGQIPWLVDGPEGHLARIWGPSLPNLQLVVDPQGRVLQALEWSDPAALRNLLDSIFLDWRSSTRTAPPSTTARLRLADQRPARVATGPIEKPLYMPRLEVEPVVEDDDRPYFLKLRAEVQRPVLKGQPGKLYLRFDLDPVYRTSWEVSEATVRVEFRTPEPLPRTLQVLAAPARPLIGTRPAEWLLDSPSTDRPMEVRIRARVTLPSGEPIETVQRFVISWREHPG